MGRASNFHDFLSEELNFEKRAPPQKNFQVGILKSQRSNKMRSCIFLRLMFKKVALLSYNHIPKFQHFCFWKKWFLQPCQKLPGYV
jgi:hypothetical protein